MDILDRTKEICQLYDIWPKRSKGQNFLINDDVYEKIISSANLKKADIVLEVGPGLGFLTSKLAQKVKKVFAVELDDKLALYLKDATVDGGVENVEIINENILDFDIKKFGEKFAYKIVANLPYNITSVFLRKFLTSEKKPKELVLMLQKEVAERICAQPGDMSLLALSIQFYAEPEIIEYVPKKDFWPAPEVDSAIIRIKLRPAKSTGEILEKDFFRLAKIGFSAKRKMLKNNLANGLHITSQEAEEKIVKIGLNPKIRAEDLSIKDWGSLLKLF